MLGLRGFMGFRGSRLGLDVLVLWFEGFVALGVLGCRVCNCRCLGLQGFGACAFSDFECYPCRSI